MRVQMLKQRCLLEEPRIAALGLAAESFWEERFLDFVAEVVAGRAGCRFVTGTEVACFGDWEGMEDVLREFDEWLDEEDEDDW